MNKDTHEKANSEREREGERNKKISGMVSVIYILNGIKYNVL